MNTAVLLEMLSMMALVGACLYTILSLAVITGYILSWNKTLPTELEGSGRFIIYAALLWVAYHYLPQLV